MATAPTASGDKVQATDPLAGIMSLLQSLGGTQTTQTTNPGDTAALQNVLGQLRGADYSAMLQSIFQQAGGQIPGLQQALGNAIGARSGSNSAVQAALSKLLQQTTVAAQDQMAKQQLANQQAQIQAGQGIASATRGTQTTQNQGTNIKAGATNLAKGTALLQLLSSAAKATGSGNIQEALGKLGTSLGLSSAPAAGGISDPNAPQMSYAPGRAAGGLDIASVLSGAPAAAPSFDFTADMGTGSFAFEPTTTPTFDMSPSDMTFVADPNAYEFGTNWWE